MAKGDGETKEQRKEPGSHSRRLTADERNPAGVNSGMTKRLMIADGSFVPTESGGVPGEVWNPLRAKRK